MSRALGLLGAAIAGGLAVGGAAAQTVAPQPGEGELSTSIQIEILSVNEEIVCRPQTVSMPAETPVELSVVNGTERPVMFLTEVFFEAADVADATSFALQTRPDGFLVDAEDEVKVAMRTPPAGEYAYSCYEPGQLPTPASAGFLLAVPPEAGESAAGAALPMAGERNMPEAGRR